MRRQLLVSAVISMAICGCAKTGGHMSSASGERSMGRAEEAESGETKVELSQTPSAVQQTLREELKGAELDDIARKQQKGQTVYEADIIKGRHVWEVLVGEDGHVIHRKQEEAVERSSAAGDDDFRQRFDVNKASLKPTGSNQYLPVQPGKVNKLGNKKDTLTVSILNDTQMIDGVKVGILEERETKNGQLEEVSRNFLATDPATNDVYYLGEDVDNYKDGKVTNHESAWHAGEKGAHFGLMLPGNPKKGDKFYQEIAPKVAMDRVEIVSTDETVKTPAGTFEHCVHLKETTPLEGEVSHKYFAPGVGMIKDDEFELLEKP